MPSLVDHEGGPVGAAELVVEHAVGLGDLAVGPEVRQQGELVALLFGPDPLGVAGVARHGEHLHAGGFVGAEVIAQLTQLALAHAGEGERIEDQRDGLVAAEARELHRFVVLVLQLEVRCFITDLDAHGLSPFVHDCASMHLTVAV